MTTSSTRNTRKQQLTKEMSNVEEPEHKRQRKGAAEPMTGEAATGEGDGAIASAADPHHAGNTPAAAAFDSEADSAQDEMSHEDEFGTEVAYILRNEVLPTNPPALAMELFDQALHDPAAVREWIKTKAAGISCSCVTPLPTWDEKNPNAVKTCGRQQGLLVSRLSMEVNRGLRGCFWLLAQSKAGRLAWWRPK